MIGSRHQRVDGGRIAQHNKVEVQGWENLDSMGAMIVPHGSFFGSQAQILPSLSCASLGRGDIAAILDLPEQARSWILQTQRRVAFTGNLRLKSFCARSAAVGRTVNCSIFARRFDPGSDPTARW